MTNEMPIIQNAINESNRLVSTMRDLSPLREPGKPIDSRNKCENGKNTNSDKFENRKIKFHRPFNLQKFQFLIRLIR